MSEWRVIVQGDDSDLSKLSASLTNFDLRLVKEEGSFHLISNRLNALTDASEVQKEATTILSSLNGLTKLFFRSTKPLSVGSLILIEKDGRKLFCLLTGVEAIGFCGTLATLKIDKDGTTETAQPENPILSGSSLASSDKQVAQALNLYGKAAQPWKDLYPIFEIIKSDVDGKDVMVDHQWTTKATIDRFTRTANHEKAAGDGARHAASTTQPPANPMTSSEAGDFIESLMKHWISFKCSQTP